MSDQLLINWLAADAKIASIKQNMDDLQKDLDWAKKESDQAREVMKEAMQTTGEYELDLKGEYCDYKVYYTTPRKSVKVDVEAVPDEFCKIVKTPKLKEIGELLESETPPNWARYELGESKLTYKMVKK